MDINRADLFAMRQRHLAEPLYEGPEGSVLWQEGAVYSDILDGAQLRAALAPLHLQSIGVCAVKSRSAAEAAKELFGFSNENPCTQWVYTLLTPPDDGGFDIRILERKDVPLAAAHYHMIDDPLDYFYECIEREWIWGLYDAGQLAGFIGMHEEGSMGMLEILPEFRRKGYGYALEAHLIGVHLQRGWTPYCHVVDGNTASLALQTKLGLTQATLPAIWVY